MSKHHADLIMCYKQPGIHKGLWCASCEDRCPICDSHVNSKREVRVCDECHFGQQKGKCIICGKKGEIVASYCNLCVKMEKDRDGCPMVLTLSSKKADFVFAKKKKS